MARSWPALELRTPDDLVQAALTDFAVTAIDDNAPDVWRVFFHSPSERDRAAAALQRVFPNLSCRAVDVPDEDWATRSQADLKAIRVGKVVVAPPWDVGSDIGSAEALPHRHITIVIQPSMGFGTGHHATTRLCLEHLQQRDLRNRSAIDVGTGSGVLAITASRLGAIHVLAIDDDPDALEAARQNVARNPGVEVTLGQLDVRRAMLRAFDLVLANLTGGLLTSAATALLALTGSGGRLILSGFMAEEEARVLNAFSSCTIDRRSQEDEWVCVTLSRSH